LIKLISIWYYLVVLQLHISDDKYFSDKEFSGNNEVSVPATTKSSGDLHNHQIALFRSTSTIVSSLKLSCSRCPPPTPWSHIYNGILATIMALLSFTLSLLVPAMFRPLSVSWRRKARACLSDFFSYFFLGRYYR